MAGRGKRSGGRLVQGQGSGGGRHGVDGEAEIGPGGLLDVALDHDGIRAGAAQCGRRPIGREGLGSEHQRVLGPDHAPASVLHRQRRRVEEHAVAGLGVELVKPCLVAGIERAGRRLPHLRRSGVGKVEQLEIVRPGGGTAARHRKGIVARRKAEGGPARGTEPVGILERTLIHEGAAGPKQRPIDIRAVGRQAVEVDVVGLGSIDRERILGDLARHLDRAMDRQQVRRHEDTRLERLEFEAAGQRRAGGQAQAVRCAAARRCTWDARIHKSDCSIRQSMWMEINFIYLATHHSYGCMCVKIDPLGYS